MPRKVYLKVTAPQGGEILRKCIQVVCYLTLSRFFARVLVAFKIFLHEFFKGEKHFTENV